VNWGFVNLARAGTRAGTGQLSKSGLAGTATPQENCPGGNNRYEQTKRPYPAYWEYGLDERWRGLASDTSVTKADIVCVFFMAKEIQ